MKASVLLCNADRWCRTVYKACANSWSTYICGWVHFVTFEVKFVFFCLQ